MTWQGNERRENKCSDCPLMKNLKDSEIGKLKELTETLTGKKDYEYSDTKPMIIIMENNNTIKEKLIKFFHENNLEVGNQL